MVPKKIDGSKKKINFRVVKVFVTTWSSGGEAHVATFRVVMVLQKFFAGWLYTITDFYWLLLTFTLTDFYRI